MLTLACGHVAFAAPGRACPHLVPTPEEGAEHVRVLTGRGMEYDLVCLPCEDTGEASELVEICEGCAERITDGGDLAGWRGAAGVLERPEALDTTVLRWALPAELGTVTGIAPVGGDPASRWLALTADGRLAELRPDDGRYRILARVEAPDEPGRTPRLVASADGRFAAVVNDYGRRGRVFDLERDGAVTMELDGGTRDSDQVPFSVAFVEHDGRPVLVHRTDWNRLDVSDPRSGELLTDRSFAEAGPHARPEHHLDYFHGALAVSADGRWIADDGWIWHPVGIPVVWDLRRWLSGNVWESEDGPSLRSLCHRYYHWDVPMCFVGAHNVAIGGIGEDDLAMLPGARVFSAGTGHEVAVFAGPTGRYFADALRLYSAHEDGLHVWDPVTGHRTGTVPGFAPTHHHPGAGELAALVAGELLRWRTGRA